LMLESYGDPSCVRMTRLWKMILESSEIKKQRAVGNN
jgi:hypothetical protein